MAERARGSGNFWRWFWIGLIRRNLPTVVRVMRWAKRKASRLRYLKGLADLQDLEYAVAERLWPEFQAQLGAIETGATELSMTGLVEISVFLEHLGKVWHDSSDFDSAAQAAFLRSILPSAVAEFAFKNMGGPE